MIVVSIFCEKPNDASLCAYAKNFQFKIDLNEATDEGSKFQQIIMHDSAFTNPQNRTSTIVLWYKNTQSRGQPFSSFVKIGNRQSSMFFSPLCMKVPVYKSPRKYPQECRSTCRYSFTKVSQYNSRELGYRPEGSCKQNRRRLITFLLLFLRYGSIPQETYFFFTATILVFSRRQYV